MRETDKKERLKICFQLVRYGVTPIGNASFFGGIRNSSFY
jgi:hypothetical protein